MKKNYSVKEKIVDTASELFHKNGYNQTGINEIVEKAGVAKATLYYHFRTKENLGLKYIEKRYFAFNNSVKKICSRNEKGIPQIMGLFEYASKICKSREYRGNWGINLISELPKEEKKFHEKITEAKLDFIDFIESLLKKNLKFENDSECAEVAKKIYLLFESSITQSYLLRNKWPLEYAEKICEKLLENYSISTTTSALEIH